MLEAIFPFQQHHPIVKAKNNNKNVKWQQLQETFLSRHEKNKEKKEGVEGRDEYFASVIHRTVFKKIKEGCVYEKKGV